MNLCDGKTLMKPFILLSICWLAMSCSSIRPSPDAEAGLPLSWVALGPNGTVVVRHLTREASCPTLKTGSTVIPLQARIDHNDRPEFEIRICEAILDRSIRSAEINGVGLALPKAAPERIVIIGDTGCRVKTKKGSPAWIQDCSNPEAWPFQKISEAAARLNPDLVIHTGDYLYRESACPGGAKGCEAFPSGDTFASWNADFLTPARSLLTRAPWIFVRGNHESCTRAGEGYFRLLDPQPFNPVCIEEPEPYLVAFSSIRFAVLDTSLKAVRSERIRALKPLKLSSDVLLSHRPLWGEENAETVGPVPGAKLVFSGHWHLFHLSTYEDGRAMQVVVGNSGTELIKNPRQSPTGTEVDGTSLKESSLIPGFGFTVLEKAGGHWELQARDVTGQVKMRKKIRLTPSP
jgi:predicted phosphodiesterase